jgi:hypothetical protein
MVTSRTDRPKYENQQGSLADASERRRGDGAVGQAVVTAPLGRRS